MVKNNYYNWLIGALAVVLIGFLVCFIFWPYPDKDLGPNMVTAFLGVFLSGAITLVLLKGQTKAESDKDRDLKLFEKKLATYSEFHKLLWKNEGDEISIPPLRDMCMGELVFYLNAGQIQEITNHLNKLTEAIKKDYSKDITDARSAITSLLKLDLDREKVEPKNIAKLFSAMPSQTEDDSHEENMISQPVVESASAVSINTEPAKTGDVIVDEKSDAVNQDAICINNTFWHFAMWGAEQLTSLSEGNYELNLIEYDQDWRTNLMRQVKKDDLIFLFRSGGPGYMGVFRALGWRIFEFKENDECIETLYYFGGDELEILDKERIEKDLLRSDIYKSREDGATLCSSLIVEPLAFACKGIGNPGGTYRRTISRYDREYGFLQLARFMAIMDDNNVYNIFDNKPMGCNKELFKHILESGNITPAPRDDNGNFK